MEKTQQCSGLNAQQKRCDRKKKTQPPYFCDSHLDQRKDYNHPMPSPPADPVADLAMATTKTDISKPAVSKDHLMSLIQDVEISLAKLKVALAQM